MNISLNWLKKYINVDGISTDELSEILTTIGLEIEGVEERELVRGGLAGVVVGEVKTCKKHPDADKLNVTTVDVGGEAPLQIVCGAPNVAAGQKVLVATIGTMLYNADEPWKIKKGKIRGQLSEGMICAEDELGLGQSHEGILVMPAEAKVGSLAAEHFDLGNDTVFEVGLTPNRSDATSHIGVAKDLYAYLKVNKGYTADVKEPEVSRFDVKQTNMKVEVDVLDLIACPRYTGITLTNIEVKESPGWMQKLLLAVGVRPINNVVDITNFILHETGQPLHAFDYDKIAGHKIIVDKLPGGKSFTTLDKQERTLDKDDLMICDGEKAGLCIAGVFGGIGSGVTEDTKTIFLESAHFDAAHIRKTSTRHLLRTDAAKVFEKGSDPNITLYALKRAVLLLEEYAGALVASEVIDIYPKEIKPVEVYLTYEKVNKLIGNPITNEDIHNILRAMDMEILPAGEEGFKVLVPTNKADVTRDVDVIEEILRIYGFNKIEIPTKVLSTLNYSSHPDKKDIKNKVADRLTALGYNEMMGLSLIESKYYRDVYIVEDSELVYINNTSNIHLDIMRPEMLISGLLSVVHNHNRQQPTVRLYEYGKSYRKRGEGFEETELLTIFLTGQRQAEHWMVAGSAAVDFYDIKKAVHEVLGRIGVDNYQISEVEDDRFAYGLHYHRGPKSIVRYGQVADHIAMGVGVKSSVFYAEIDVAQLVESTKNINTKLETISKYPSVRRDLALVVDKKVKFADIQQIAQKADKKRLKDVRLFDIYTNEEHVGKGKKSYAVSYLFEDQEKTLVDKEVDHVMKKLMEQYEAKLGALIRS